MDVQVIAIEKSAPPVSDAFELFPTVATVTRWSECVRNKWIVSVVRPLFLYYWLY